MGVLGQPGGRKWGLSWGLLCGTSARKKLCTTPCHSCHIYGIWRSKKVGDALKSSFGVTMQAAMGDSFYGEGRFSLCNTAVLKHYCKSLLGIVKHFIGHYLFSLYYCYFTSFISAETGKAKNVLKFIWLTLSYSVWWCPPAPILVIKTLLTTVSQEYIYCNKKSIISESCFFEIKKFPTYA